MMGKGYSESVASRVANNVRASSIAVFTMVNGRLFVPGVKRRGMILRR